MNTIYNKELYNEKYNNNNDYYKVLKIFKEFRGNNNDLLKFINGLYIDLLRKGEDFWCVIIDLYYIISKY